MTIVEADRVGRLQSKLRQIGVQRAKGKSSPEVCGSWSKCRLCAREGLPSIQVGGGREGGDALCAMTLSGGLCF